MRQGSFWIVLFLDFSVSFSCSLQCASVCVCALVCHISFMACRHFSLLPAKS